MKPHGAKQQTDALPLGSTTGRELLHHTEAAVFSPDQIQDVFSGNVADAILQNDGGYVLKDGYWWNPGLTEFYYDETTHYLPWKTRDAFGAETVVTYDDYHLIPETVTDALGSVTHAEIGDHTLQPSKLTDINDNVSEVLFDALGLVIATSIYGTEDDQDKGDADLTNYQTLDDASLENILDRPEDYLQGATSYFFYDLFAWKNDGQPVHSINLLRETHVKDLSDDEESPIQTHIAYFDGFGRALQNKVKVDSGEAFLQDTDGELSRDTDGNLVEGQTDNRWLISGRTVYNNKAKPVKQYEPFYSSTAYYEPETELTSTVSRQFSIMTRYCALSRLTRPKGFSQRSSSRLGGKTLR